MAHSAVPICAKCGTEYIPTRGGWHTPPYKVHKVHEGYVPSPSGILCNACYQKITRVRSMPLRSIRLLIARVYVCAQALKKRARHPDDEQKSPSLAPALRSAASASAAASAAASAELDVHSSATGRSPPTTATLDAMLRTASASPPAVMDIDAGAGAGNSSTNAAHSLPMPMALVDGGAPCTDHPSPAAHQTAADVLRHHFAEDGPITTVSAPRGQDMTVARLPRPVIGSADASPSTLRERNLLMEMICTALSSPANATASDQQRHAIEQIVSMTKRHNRQFEQLLERLGRANLNRFTEDDILELMHFAKSVCFSPSRSQSLFVHLV